MAKPTVKELRGKIAARKAEREAKKKQKFTKMRSAAEKAPEKMEKRLAGLAEKCASMTEAIENLRMNLGLHRSAKEAPLRVRVATARNYGKTFKRIAEEAPERLAEAVTEAYNGLNDIAADLEMAADELGINLENGMEQEMGKFKGDAPNVPEGIVEEAVMEGESPEHEMSEKLEGEGDDEEKEASGSDAWVTDRDDNGQPKAPITANSGSDAFVTDRDKGAEPEKPAKMEVPQAQGKAAGESKVAMSRKDYILIADAIRSFRMPNQQREDLARHLSKYLRGDNYNFSEGIFVDYVLGRGGSHGGGKFKGDEPNVPDTLFT